MRGGDASVQCGAQEVPENSAPAMNDAEYRRGIASPIMLLLKTD